MIMPTWVIIFLTIIFAAFTKLADLGEEHGVKFKFGSNYLFAIIWGMAGALCIASGNVIASGYFIAENLQHIVRGRIDNFRHGLATFIALSPFIFSDVKIALSIVIPAFLIMSIFGFLHDSLAEVERPKIKKVLEKIKLIKTFFEYRAYYYVVFFFWALIIKEWLLFFIPLVGMGTYEIIRQIGEKKILKKYFH